MDLTADYGLLTVLAPSLSSRSNGSTASSALGRAIIIVTALIKCCSTVESGERAFPWPRCAHRPRMKQIQEYVKTTARSSVARDGVYKKEKINPWRAACRMVSRSLFISFYWVLLESVEMRQAPS